MQDVYCCEPICDVDSNISSVSKIITTILPDSKLFCVSSDIFNFTITDHGKHWM